MEPLSTTAIAILSLISTRALEKIGEAVGKKLSEQSGELLKKIKLKSPNTADVLESANLQTNNLVKVIHEVELIANNDEEFAQKLNQIRDLTRDELLAIVLKEREDPIVLNSKSNIPLEKFADKVGVYVNGGGTVNIENFNF
ncbi:hypothetical protein [Nostoc sp.]|uniref:hypothetical protein n=1 Tax=Nostoc sp. TaxID=1180 RepID=UPI002FF55C8C